MFYAHILNDKLLDISNVTYGGDFENIEVSETIFQLYSQNRNKVGYIDGEVIEISQTPEYLAEQKLKAKQTIIEKYKNIINDYVCAKVKRDLIGTVDYQSMITDMYNEIGGL